MGKIFTDYILLKNKWFGGTKVAFSIDSYSEVVQIASEEAPILILNEDELREFIKVCEKSLDSLRGK